MKMTVVTTLALLLTTAAQAGYKNVPSYVFETTSSTQAQAQASLLDCKADLAAQAKALSTKGARMLSVSECSMQSMESDQGPSYYTVTGTIQFL